MAKLVEYRGHIRNWKTLCKELGIDKALPAKEREEAILVAGYERWGTGLARHLFGMFALTIEDGDKVFGLRDQFGTKPYYYYVTEDGRLLASLSIRRITEQDGFVKELNPALLQLYLTYP